MDAAEVLKSYLVSLGFGIDDPSYAKFRQTLEETTRNVSQHTEGITKAYVLAGGAVVSALAAISAATLKLIDNVAQADLGYQKFAMHMFMGVDAAKQMKIATDALGESINDIAWMPELRERYNALIQQERGMELPKDAAGQMRHMRDIRFEFTRLKVEMTYGMQWIGYNLIKGLADPLEKGHQGFKRINDWIQKNMPVWTEKIANVAGAFVRLGGSIIRFIVDIAGHIGTLISKFKEIYDSMPKWAKAIIVGLGSIATFMAMGPFGRAVTIISTLILLLDDFYAYVDGRKSAKALAPIWQTLIMAGDTIIRIMTAAAVLIDDIFSGKKSNWKDIINDVKSAYTDIEGLTHKMDGQIKNEGGKVDQGKGLTNEAIMDAAKMVSAKTGIRPDLIFAQWAHETGNFTSNQAVNMSNLAGIKGAGGQFRRFNSLDDFASFYASMMNNPKWAEVRDAGKAGSPEAFVNALAKANYFEKSDYPAYMKDLPRLVRQYQGRWSGANAYPAMSPAALASRESNTTIDMQVGPIHFHGNVDKNQVMEGVKTAMNDAREKLRNRQAASAVQ